MQEVDDEHRDDDRQPTVCLSAWPAEAIRRGPDLTWDGENTDHRTNKAATASVRARISRRAAADSAPPAGNAMNRYSVSARNGASMSAATLDRTGRSEDPS